MARREYGQGSVYKRESDGYYIAALRFPTPDGKTKTVTRSARTEKEAKAKLRDLRRLRERGEQLARAQDTPTIEELYTHWLTLKSETLRVRTQETYTTCARTLLLPYIGQIGARDLTVTQVDIWLRTLAKTHAKSTVEKARRILGGILKEGERRNLLERNVATLSLLPPCKPSKREQQDNSTRYTKERASEVLALLDGRTNKYGAPTLSVIIVTIIGLGLRIGETLGLEWDKFSRDEQGQFVSVTISQQVTEGAGGKDLGDPKTNAGNRTLPVPSFVSDALLRQWAWCEKMKAGRWCERNLTPLLDGDRETDFVFLTQNRDIPSRTTVRRDLNLLLKEAGIEAMSPHQFRHLCASVLSEKGVPDNVVAAILGHAEVRITKTRYIHPSQDAMNRAAAHMEAMRLPSQTEVLSSEITTETTTEDAPNA